MLNVAILHNNSGSLFHLSTALTVKENFLGSVLANFGTRVFVPAVYLVLAVNIKKTGFYPWHGTPEESINFLSN
jgi:hypothetical protein